MNGVCRSHVSVLEILPSVGGVYEHHQRVVEHSTTHGSIRRPQPIKSNYLKPQNKDSWPQNHPYHVIMVLWNQTTTLLDLIKRIKKR